jgi:hypothetical protein
MKLFFHVLAIALLVFVAKDYAYASLVTNGSFETVQIGAPFNSNNPADIPGWTHTGAQGDALLWAIGYTDGGGAVTVAGDGNQFVTMGGGFNQPSQTSAWDQVLNGLTPGASYLLTFEMAAEADYSGDQTITVSFPSGSSTPAQSFSSAPGGHYWTNWVSQSETFVATSTSVDLMFSANTSFDVGLDDVSVVPMQSTGTVPEPSTLIIWSLLGFGSAFGMRVWRRRGSSLEVGSRGRRPWSPSARNAILEIVERGCHS